MTLSDLAVTHDHRHQEVTWESGQVRHFELAVRQSSDSILSHPSHEPQQVGQSLLILSGRNAMSLGP